MGRPPRLSSVVIVAAIAAIAATAGCHGGTTTSAKQSSPAATRTAESVSYAMRERDRTRRAIAFARRAAAEVAQIRGETPLTAEPPAALVKPQEVIGTTNLITEAHYWTAPGSPLRVYRVLKRSPRSPFGVTGYGAPGEGSDPPGSAFVAYNDVPAPAYIQDAEVYVEIDRYAAGRSVIASFAEVDTHPVRMAGEVIAAAGSTGVYTWPRLDAGKVVGHASVTIGPGRLRTLIRDFDRANISNAPNVCFGVFVPAGDALTLRITSGGHTWKLVYPGTSCGDIAVWRDGTQLAAITPGHLLRHRLGVLEHRDGIVVGRLLEVGGPAGAQPSPASGVVTLRSHGHTVASIHANRAGHFDIDAAAGRYTLTGSTPHYRIDGHRGGCAADHKVPVRSDTKVHADVYCERR
jgi:hypothetical protein